MPNLFGKSFTTSSFANLVSADMAASSTRPYLIRAIYDWANENALTPFLLVDARGEGVVVPEQFVEDNSIVLNIAPSAVRELHIGDEFISFNARFAGKAQELFVPVENVRAVYAKENGEGLVLPEDSPPNRSSDADQQTTQRPNSDATKKITALTAVKNDGENMDVSDSTLGDPSVTNEQNREPKEGPKKSPPNLTIVD